MAQLDNRLAVQKAFLFRIESFENDMWPFEVN